MNGKIERCLQNKNTICLDTAPIIYFIEENQSFLSPLKEIFLRIDEGGLRAIASYITLIEVLVHPIEKGAHQLAKAYRDLLIGSPGFNLYPVERKVSEKAAELRAKYKSFLKIPDAIQIATAISFGAQIFITNDADLKRIQEIEIVDLTDLQ